MRWSVMVAALAVLACGCASSRSAPSADAEIRAGVHAATREYWQEALFRFQRAQQLEPENFKVLNNIAVSLEALGRYEDALGMYKKALEKSPSNTALKRNYARFAEFYTSLARGVKPKETGHAKP